MDIVHDQEYPLRGDAYDVTPSESGSDPGEKSDDSGYKGSIGKTTRSLSQRIIFSCATKPEFPRSQTWQEIPTRDIEYRRSEFKLDDINTDKRRNTLQKDSENFGRLSRDNILSGDYRTDPETDEHRRKLSFTARKASLQNVRRGFKYVFSSVKAFVICLSLLQLFQVMGSGYSKSALTSIERRYRLSTFQIGFLQSCFHFGNLSVILFVSYYGSKWNRPRAIAIGSFLMALSSFLSATPQFVGSRYSVHSIESSRNLTGPGYTQNPDIGNLSDHNTGINSGPVNLAMRSGDTLCVQRGRYGDSDFGMLTSGGVPETRDAISDVTSGQLAGSRSDLYWNDASLYLFIALGSVLKGMGHSPLHPLGMSYIDDFATPRNSAVYIGVVSGLSLLGPAFGFILGSITTRQWVDVGWVDASQVTMNPRNPMWVGAWWMGYLVTGCLLLFATVPLCFFPRIMEKEQKEDDEPSRSFPTLFRQCCPVRPTRSNESDHSDTESLRFDDRKTSECDVTTEKRDRRVGGVTIISEGLNSRNVTNNTEFEGEFKKSKSDGQSTYRLSANLAKTNHERKDLSARYHSRKGNHATSNDSESIPRRLSIVKCELGDAGDHSQGTGTKLPSKGDTRRRPSRLEKLQLIDFTASIKGRLTDSVFLSITFGLVSLTGFLAASVTYVSKYMETQFGITASYANLLNGSVNLPMLVVGNLLGGWLIRRFDLNVRRTMFVVVVGISMTIVSVTALLLFKCNTSTSSDYFVGAASGDCASNCSCGQAYSPVCDLATDITYMSPCHAGCTTAVMEEGKKIYADCKCLIRSPEINKLSPVDSGKSAALFTVPGSCNVPDCLQSHLPVFLGVMGAASLTAGVASTPSSLLILRVVPPAEKAIGIAIVFVFTRVLAWVPSPVYVGYLIDSACMRWSAIKSSHDYDEAEQSRCEMYDKDRLRNHFFAATGSLLVLSLFFYCLAMFYHRKKSRLRRKQRSIARRQLAAFSNTLNISNNTSPGSTLTSQSRTSSIARDLLPSDKGSDDKDQNFNEYPSESRVKLIVSSALEKTFSVAISVSTPSLAKRNAEYTSQRARTPSDASYVTAV